VSHCIIIWNKIMHHFFLTFVSYVCVQKYLYFWKPDYLFYKMCNLVKLIQKHQSLIGSEKMVYNFFILIKKLEIRGNSYIEQTN